MFDRKRCSQVLFFVLVYTLLHCLPTYVQASTWVWPVKGKLTDTFGTRGGKHYGIDIAAPTGTTVVAVSKGVVSKSYYSASYGNVVFIKHPTGFETVYAHLTTRCVEEGVTVSQGEKIGKVGNTGHSFGAHLHFEMHRGEWNVEKTLAVNPLHYIDEQKVIPVFHTVEKGDTLTQIAKKYKTHVALLKKENALSTDFIYPDQQLKVR
ncbi:MAG: peptidoglycan DD-metalloendopeptidase family protein [Bacilli bacterium]